MWVIGEYTTEIHHRSKLSIKNIAYTSCMPYTRDMAKPKSKTTVSVLRSIIGISAEKFAELIGRSIHTVKSLESGRLGLSEELAIKISVETGVSANWLLAGDPQAQPLIDSPPFGPNLGIFTKETFEARRADRMQNREGGIIVLHVPWFESAKLNAISEAAEKSGSGRLAHYRISKFLGELEKEFGITKERFDAEKRKWELWSEFENLFEDPDGEPALASHREFVPSFIKTYKKLVNVANNRLKKHNFKEPGIFPLLLWARKAMEVISPSVPHKLLSRKARGAAKASGSWKPRV